MHKMYDKKSTLERLSGFGDLNSPIGTIIHSSLEIAELLTVLLQNFSEEEKNKILSSIFLDLDLGSVTINELIDKTDEYYRNPV